MPSPSTSPSLLEQARDYRSEAWRRLVGLSQTWDAQHDRHVLHGLMKMVRPDFTEATWTAFRRIALEGASAAVVAQELDLSVNAVLIAKSRVLTRLRQEARGLVDS
jgi:RNA polymerase sigma-70 factor (ECF subfamily)